MSSFENAHYPIVIIPGLMSSRMEAKYKDKWVPTWVDIKVMEFGPSFAGVEPNPGEAAFAFRDLFKSRAEIEPVETLPQLSDWWIQNMQLDSDGIHPLPGNDSRPMSGLDAVTYLDPGIFTSGSSWVFGPLVNYLEKAGYTPDSLIAAPYDWRLPPCGLAARYGYFEKLKQSIEELARNNNSRVLLLAHSLGNRVTQYFLRTVDQEWIDNYIERYVAVSPLWLGAPKAVRALISGASEMPLMSDEVSASLARTCGSAPWMFPVTKPQYKYMNTEYFAFLGSDTEGRSIDAMLDLAGVHSSEGFWQKYYVDDPNYAGGDVVVQPPPIDRLTCIYSTGVKTEVGYYYEKQGDRYVLDKQAVSSNPNFEVKDGIRYETNPTHQFLEGGKQFCGDGTVPYGSLAYFKQWQQAQPERDIQGVEIPGPDHRYILADGTFMKTVLQISAKNSNDSGAMLDHYEIRSGKSATVFLNAARAYFTVGKWVSKDKDNYVESKLHRALSPTSSIEFRSSPVEFHGTELEVSQMSPQAVPWRSSDTTELHVFAPTGRMIDWPKPCGLVHFEDAAADPDTVERLILDNGDERFVSWAGDGDGATYSFALYPDGVVLFYSKDGTPIERYCTLFRFADRKPGQPWKAATPSVRIPVPAEVAQWDGNFGITAASPIDPMDPPLPSESVTLCFAIALRRKGPDIGPPPYRISFGQVTINGGSYGSEIDVNSFKFSAYGKSQDAGADFLTLSHDSYGNFVALWRRGGSGDLAMATRASDGTWHDTSASVADILTPYQVQPIQTSINTLYYKAGSTQRRMFLYDHWNASTEANYFYRATDYANPQVATSDGEGRRRAARPEVQRLGV